MKTTKVYGIDVENGRIITGDMVICDDCSGSVFNIIKLDDVHLHFVCTNCGHCYCDNPEHQEPASPEGETKC